MWYCLFHFTRKQARFIDCNNDYGNNQPPNLLHQSSNIFNDFVWAKQFWKMNERNQVKSLYGGFAFIIYFYQAEAQYILFFIFIFAYDTSFCLRYEFEISETNFTVYVSLWLFWRNGYRPHSSCSFIYLGGKIAISHFEINTLVI